MGIKGGGIMLNSNKLIEEDWERVYLIEQMYLDQETFKEEILPAKIEVVDLRKKKHETEYSRLSL